MAGNIARVATYRLQLTPTFGLRGAAAILPYLADLGISHVYTSSYLQAAPGSTHGYDTTDHAVVDQELGGEAALAEFQTALHTNGLGHVVDVVPNHMCVADPALNRRWWNVLKDGASSPDARFFDIDWDTPTPWLRGKILLPVLGRDYGIELADGAIEFVDGDGDGEPQIRYGDHHFPISAPLPRTGAPPTGMALHEILERQHYRLVCWRVGRDELNYRRFFDITTLAAVRVEDPAVFADVHRRTLEWVAAGHVQGLRIDHPDGLRDPAGYFAQLRAAAPETWIVIEKILEPGEDLPPTWPIDGTTGYDSMRWFTSVFVDPTAEQQLNETFEAFVGDEPPYARLVSAAKQQVLNEMLGAELSRLERLTVELCATSVAARDFSRRDIRRALAALLIAMPVYRTYVTVGTAGVVRSDADAAMIDRAVAGARSIEPTIDAALFDELWSLLRGDLTQRWPAQETAATATIAADFVARFQQLSGPVMAKGVEDTLFYRYNRLAALNEVGADPSHFGCTIDAFHTAMTDAAASHRNSMNATSTHDTKRSEDVRARMVLLSEVAQEWDTVVRRWRAMNHAAWGGQPPEPAAEYRLYQTLFGAHPLSVERAQRFMVKALREAKQITSWLRPTAAEARVLEFAERIIESAEFQRDLSAFVAGLERPARLAALAQLTLKAMSPGIPDFYQGSELWTTSLVDPDNRDDVDWDVRRRMLAAIDTGNDRPDTDRAFTDGSVKLWLTRRLLQVRRLAPDSFTGDTASYSAQPLHGERAGDAIAFRRGSGVIIVVPVRPVTIVRRGWGDTSIELPSGRWIDALGAPRGPALEGRVAIAALAGTLGIVVLIAASLEQDEVRS